MTTNRLVKRLLLTLLAIAVSVLPPAIATLLYFPVWAAEGGELVISGMTALVLVVAAMPIYNIIKKRLRSPAIWSVWLTAFIAFMLLSRIADEMTVISFAGFLSNLAGSVIFKLARRCEVTDVEQI